MLYKIVSRKLTVFLVHPGGPFWKNKDLGAWSIPKGEYGDENPLDAAIREFEEETGIKPDGPFLPLAPVKLKSGKVVYGWAWRGDFDPAKMVSNEIEIEWPPRSGKKISIPEVDKGEWFWVDDALEKINPAQCALILELIQKLDSDLT